uniref:Uncharacterized protein n=1 Tax=Fagus sylvatica TaxID=28930 RepID=A0A2N9EJU6_FAGSY
MCTGSGTTAHNPRSGGDPRLEGDPTPRRREPPQPEPVACRAHSHGLEVTHGQGCRSGGDPRPRLPPGVAVPDPCRSGGDPRPSLPPGVAVPTGMSFAASPSLSPWSKSTQPPSALPPSSTTRPTLSPPPPRNPHHVATPPPRDSSSRFGKKSREAELLLGF